MPEVCSSSSKLTYDWLVAELICPAPSPLLHTAYYANPKMRFESEELVARNLTVVAAAA